MKRRPRPRHLLRLAVDPDARRRWRRERFLASASRYARAIAIRDRRGNCYLIDPRDKVIGRALFIDGAYEAAVLDAALDALDGFVPRGLIDIGANLGTVSVEVLTRFPEAVGVAFEPDPANAWLLEQNLRANELDDRVRVFPIALGDRDGELELELSGDNFGDHRIRTSPQAGSFGEERREVRPVRACRFDGLGDLGVPLDGSTLVSLDAQGYEGHILAGGSSLLACPILVEFWPYGLSRADGLGRFLSALGAYSAILELRGEPREVSPADLEGMTRALGVHSTDLLLVP